MAKHVLIIGGGPAGCSAAMTLRLRGEDVTILYSGEGALGRAKRVDNYPGLAQMRGGEMLSAFRRQAEEMGAALRPGVARRFAANGRKARSTGFALRRLGC